MRQSGNTGDIERRQGYTELVSLVTRMLESSQARDEITAVSAERLQTVVDTTREIKEQLLLMNGRVRQNEKDIVAVKANPPLTRERCDTQRGKLDRRIRELEGKVPALVQYLIVGGAMAVVSYLFSQLP